MAGNWRYVAVTIVLATSAFVYGSKPFETNGMVTYQLYGKTYKVPKRFVVPGTLPGTPSPPGYDKNSDAIYLYLPANFLRQRLPNYSLKNFQGGPIGVHIKVGLTNNNEPSTWFLTGRTVGVFSLEGDFENATVKKLEGHEAYKILPVMTDGAIVTEWTLLTYDPNIQEAVLPDRSGSFIGQCHQFDWDPYPSCEYEVTLNGFGARINMVSEDLLLLRQLKTTAEELLESWRI